jgi:hypothetical protein
MRFIRPCALSSTAIAATLVCLSGPATAEGKQKSQGVIKQEAQETLALTKVSVERAAGQLEQQLLVVAAARVNARKADDALLADKADKPQETVELARKAAAADAALKAAQLEERQRAQRLDSVKALLRQVALDIDQCGVDADRPCTAQTQAQLVNQLAAAHTPEIVATQLDKLADQLVTAAAGAQAKVTKEKAHAAVAYAKSDAAMATALESKHSDDKTLRGKELREQARAAFEATPVLRDAVSKAQVASNELVDHALRIQECQGGDKAKCKLGLADAVQMAAEAQLRMEGQLSAARDQYATLLLSAYGTDAAAKYGKRADRQQAVQFAQMLDRFGDARSLFGDNSGFTLRAGKQGTDLALKFSTSRVLPAGWSQSSIIVSTPPADSSSTSLFSTEGGVPRASTITFTQAFARASDIDQKLAGLDLLSSSGWSVSYGNSSHSHFTSVDPKSNVDTRKSLWGLSTYMTLFNLTTENPAVHVFKLGLGSGYADQKKQTRCPVPMVGSVSTEVTCLTGSFAAPERELARSISYEHRLQWNAKRAIAPKLTYEHLGRKTELDVPVYLIQSEDKTSPLTAGFNLNWTNRPAAETSRLRLGVFIGSAFNLWE